MFHEVLISTVKEIQADFAGQSIQLLCSAENGLLMIFTYNTHSKNLQQHNEKFDRV